MSQEKRFIPDPSRRFLCKYHHRDGCTSDKPGNGFSGKRCPGCGKYYKGYYEERYYVSENSLARNDDENDMDRIQNAYDPPEAIINDDGEVEYW